MVATSRPDCCQTFSGSKLRGALVCLSYKPSASSEHERDLVVSSHSYNPIHSVTGYLRASLALRMFVHVVFVLVLIDGRLTALPAGQGCPWGSVSTPQ